MPARYLTAKRYRKLGLGVDLSAKTDAELTSLIDVASQMVNTFCAAPRGHDFRGGSITNEPHLWDTGNVYKPGSGRVWPFHEPIKSVSAVQIEVTNQQYINFGADSLYINEGDGYVEPIALAVTTAGVFGLSVIPNIGLRQPVARVDYTYGWVFQSTDEELTYSGGTLDAGNQFWFTDEDVVIKANGTELTAGADYTVDYTEGEVTVSNYDSATSYTASYFYPLPEAIARASSLILNDVVGQTSIAAAGLLGLSGIKVEEVELRQSGKVNFNVNPVNMAAQYLLAPYRYISIA